MPPKKGDAGAGLTEEELEQREVEMLRAEGQHQEVELKFLDDAMGKLRTDNDDLIVESNRLKIRLAAAISDAEYILHHKESEIDRKQMMIELNQEKHRKLTEELEAHEELIQELKTEILQSQKALQEADNMIEEKAQLDRKMREFQAVLDRQQAKMEEKQKLIEDRKRKLERAKVITEALEVRAASRAETKILFGEQWLVACRRYRAVGSGAQTLPSDRPGNVCAVIGGRYMLLLGGKPEQPGKDMQVVNWTSDPPQWENPEAGPLAPAMRYAIWRCGTVACPIKGSSQMFVFGGMGHSDPTAEGSDEQPGTLGYTKLGVLHNDIWMFNLRSSKPWAKQTAVKGDAPSKRMFHCGAVDRDGTQMFIFGGQDSKSLLNDVWIFSRNTNQWSQIQAETSTQPSPRVGASICVMEDGRRLLLFGGFDGTSSLDDVYVLEVDRKAWNRVKIVGSKTPRSRYCHSATLVSGRYIFVVGGTHVDGVGEARTKVPLLDTWVLDMNSYSWEQLHDAVVPAALKPESTYAALVIAEGQHKIVTVKPNADEVLNEVEIVDISLPEDIERQKLQARKESDIIATLEILSESEPASFWAYDEAEVKRAEARGAQPQPFLAGAVLLKWTVPTKNNDHVVGYKIMMTNHHGVTAEAGYGPAADFYVSPRMAQHLVTDLGTGQMVTLAVKAIYDDGSFLWSNPRAFLIPSKANKRIENGELKELVAFEA